MEKPTLPKGTRDFGPVQMAKRQFIFNTIRQVFQKYGFQPLETPAMENLTTLTGKYGEEGDQLLFRILDSGEYFHKFWETYYNVQISNEAYEYSRLKDLIEPIFKEIKKEAYHKIINKIENEMLFSGGLVRAVVESLVPLQRYIPIDFPQDYIQITTELLSENIVLSSLTLDLIKKLIEDPHDDKDRTIQVGENLLGPDLSYIIMDYLQKRKLKSIRSKEVSSKISEKGLRYDLTVPFARYVVMNRHEITFPFKRYQIQPVWRADNPQRGRYREFYQCDADVVGTNSLICEAEIILMIREVFNGLGIQNFTIKINHRGILSGLAEIAGAREKESSLFVAIDKLDKIGPEKVKEELQNRGLATQSIGQVFDILNFKGNTSEKMAFLHQKFETIESGQKGLSDFAEVLNLLKSHGASDDQVEFDLTLARGLSYYTGCIFEVKINDVGIGSVSGGGRYDNLTGVFGMPGVSGVGFSFGVDRLYDAMEELNIFPQATMQLTEVLVAHFDEATRNFGLQIAAKLRSEGISTEVYPDLVKIKKQLEFADKKKVKFTVVIGADEMKTQLLSVKNMQTGDQQKIHINDLVQHIKKT